MSFLLNFSAFKHVKTICQNIWFTCEFTGFLHVFTLPTCDNYLINSSIYLWIHRFFAGFQFSNMWRLFAQIFDLPVNSQVSCKLSAFQHVKITSQNLRLTCEFTGLLQVFSLPTCEDYLPKSLIYLWIHRCLQVFSFPTCDDHVPKSLIYLWIHRLRDFRKKAGLKVGTK